MTTAERRVQQLEDLCGELYQVLGTVGAPAHVLDKLSAAAAGEPIPDVALLPISEEDFDDIKEMKQTLTQVLDALEPFARRRAVARAGASTSLRKAASSRANGRKGGRPRKQT